MEYNAKLLITLWKKNEDTPLQEYSHREWNGLLGSLYKQRWELFFSSLTKKMNGANENDVNFYEVERKWIEEKNTSFRTTPTGDAIQICTELNKRYFSK